MPQPPPPIQRQHVPADGESGILLDQRLQGLQAGGDPASLTAAPVDDQQFRLLADNIPTLCWIANQDGYIVWYNRRWYDYTGTTLEQMQGWGWQSVHHPDELPRVMERWTDAILFGDIFEMTFPLRGADGVYRPFLTRVQPLRDEEGRISRWFGLNMDISAQEEAEAALRHSQARATQVLDGMDEGFLLLDQDFRILQMNAEGLRIDGRAAHEIIGHSHWEVYPDTEDLPNGVLFRQVLAEQKPGTIENYYDWGDGRSGWYEIRAYPAADGVAVFYRDITARRQNEAVLRDLNETLEIKIAEAVAEQQAAQESLRQAQKMEAMGQLTGGIAHDFNNLLMGIAGSLEIIQSRLTSGRTAGLEKFVSAAMSSAARATSLTQRLLAFARRQALDPKPVEVNALVISMQDLLAQTVGEQIRLNVMLAQDLWPALCDGHQLENSLLNLVINARDAMPEGGTVTIKTANAWLGSEKTTASTRASGDDQGDAVAPGDYVALSVTDTGTGMPEEVMARVFEPFFTTKPLGQGTGLGLSMLYGFARQSGGHLRIDSELGRGTSMKLYLPRHLND